MSETCENCPYMDIIPPSSAGIIERLQAKLKAANEANKIMRKGLEKVKSECKPAIIIKEHIAYTVADKALSDADAVMEGKS